MNQYMEKLFEHSSFLKSCFIRPTTNVSKNHIELIVDEKVRLFGMRIFSLSFHIINFRNIGLVTCLALAACSLSDKKNIVVNTPSEVQCWEMHNLPARKRISCDGIGTAANFTHLSGLTHDSDDNLYVLDGNSVRKVTSTGTVTTLAGVYDKFGTQEGLGSRARFNHPVAITFDSENKELYVADNITIRKVSLDGNVDLYLQDAGYQMNPDKQSHPPFPVYSKFYFSNSAIITDSQINLYVLDSSSGSLREISPNGVIKTLIEPSNPLPEYDSYFGVYTTPLNKIKTSYKDIALDNFGDIYISDARNSVIWKVSKLGDIKIFAGRYRCQGYQDGGLDKALFNKPNGIAIDNQGNLYISDMGDNIVRKITHEGIVTTLAGKAGFYGYQDGVGQKALFNRPNRLTVDESGNVYVADNSTIRKISKFGLVTTLAGQAKDLVFGQEHIKYYCN